MWMLFNYFGIFLFSWNANSCYKWLSHYFYAWIIFKHWKFAHLSRINVNSTILKSVCGGTSRFICPTSVSPVHWYRMASWFFNDHRLLSEKEIGGRRDHLLISNTLDSLSWLEGGWMIFRNDRMTFLSVFLLKYRRKG